MITRRPSLATRCVHGPPGSLPAAHPTSPSLHLSSAWLAASTEESAQVLAGTREGFSYSRLGNPTRAEAERRLAFLEETEGGLLTSSGMAAITCSLLSLLKAGDHLVASGSLYGNTRSLLHGVLSRLGIEVTHADPDEGDAFGNALTPRTKALYCETISNPTLTVANLPAWVDASRARGLPLLVDNTFATPVLCQPVLAGATLSIHSATKFLGGHGDLIAGAVLGEKSVVDEARKVAADFGCVADPFSCWLLMRGLATLPLRMERQQGTALALSRWLREQPGVVRVVHPQPRPWLGGGGALLGVELAGGKERAASFLDSLTLILRAPSLGDVHTLAVHPASTTHRQLDASALQRAGIPPGYVRLSIGLEDEADLREDLASALASAGGML